VLITDFLQFMVIQSVMSQCSYTVVFTHLFRLRFFDQSYSRKTN